MWPPGLKNQDGARPCSHAHSQRSLEVPQPHTPETNQPFTIPFLAHTATLPSSRTPNGGSPAYFTNTNTLPYRFTSPPASSGRQLTTLYAAKEQVFHYPPHEEQLPCVCTHLSTLLDQRDHPRAADHLIVTLDDLQLPPHLRHFLGANMSSTSFLPNTNTLFGTFHKAG